MKFSSGTKLLDNLLNGGYQPQMINTIFGVAASGKTTACLLACIACANRGKKVIYIDTENAFPVDRLKQLTPDYNKVLEKIFLIKAKSFEQQSKVFTRLKDIAFNTNIGLIIVDTIGSQYRSDTQDLKLKNKVLGDQLDTLREIYKTSDCIVILTNQVYSNLKENEVKPIGGRTLVNRSRCMIQLDKVEEHRYAYLIKHPNENKNEIQFTITNKGFEIL